MHAFSRFDTIPDRYLKCVKSTAKFWGGGASHNLEGLVPSPGASVDPRHWFVIVRASNWLMFGRESALKATAGRSVRRRDRMTSPADE